jgi:HAD superfamily hydrolase (TIGR01509 family)
MTRRIDLLIFDCDGVLVDSEVISTRMLRETLIGHGLTVDLAYVNATYLGRSTSVVRDDFARLTGRSLAASFETDFLARLIAAYRSDLAAMAGVEPLLDALDIPACVATSSSMERVRTSLELTGLLPRFEGRIFTSSMVARGKPAPDLFLHAARSLGAEPARCLVIEDSEAGIAAAKSAGMAVWRFIGGSHLRERSAALLAAGADVPLFTHMDAMAKALRDA